MTKARACFWAAGLVFVVFVADILLAKVQVLSGETMPVHLGDWPQFLVLLIAVIFFVAGTLVREKQEGHQEEQRTRRSNDAPTSGPA